VLSLMRRIRSWQWIVVALLCAVALVEVLNFTGFCYSQVRYLRDQELIDAAIQYRLADVGDYYLSRGAKKYNSVAEFHEINPHCCRLSKWGHPGLGEEGIWLRVIGWYVVVADLWYRFRDAGTNQFWSETVFMNSCGKVLEHAGGEMSYDPTAHTPLRGEHD
jgi:hypothetical protein